MPRRKVLLLKLLICTSSFNYTATPPALRAGACAIAPAVLAAQAPSIVQSPVKIA